MGGPMGVYEAAKYPFLTAECSLIKQLIQRGIPVLGVCLGAQLLAHALDARVFPGPGPEIGFGCVELTDAGRGDPIFEGIDAKFPAFHWHGDTFDLPQGTTLLASSTLYAHQAFRFGVQAYGLQFHVEPDAVTWQAWQTHLPARIFKNLSEEGERLNKAGQRLIANFFDLTLQSKSS